MRLRVAVYAEGAGEDYIAGNLSLSAGDELDDDRLGPAHVLARRCMVVDNAHDIQFVAPNPGSRVAVMRGSMLFTRKGLRQALTWPENPRRPHLAVVFIDQDGDSQRRTTIEGWLTDLPFPLPRVIAVPIQEFEAWLVADVKAVSDILGYPVPTPQSPEGMARREAKMLLSRWIGDHLTRSGSIATAAA